MSAGDQQEGTMTVGARYARHILIWSMSVIPALPAGARAQCPEPLLVLETLLGNVDFGSEVTTLDFNADGYDDIAVGGPVTCLECPDAGYVRLFYGGPSSDALEDFALAGQYPDEDFGIAVDAAGDVNGDGYDDLVVGARKASEGGIKAGKAYVFFGGPDPDPTPDMVLIGPWAYAFFGDDVAGLGDVNGDGYDDIIVGAPADDQIIDDNGWAFIFYGGSTPDTIADIEIEGVAIDDNFGTAVASAGDINGDGRPDVIVGAPGNDAFGDENRGRAYVLFMGSLADEFIDVPYTGEAAGDLFGARVETIGDLNDDGYDDVMVGAARNGSLMELAGAVYVFEGGPGIPDGDVDLVLRGTEPQETFGVTLANVGDLTGDGFDEIAVGSLWGTYAGRVYLFRGGPDADATADLVLDGGGQFDYFGNDLGRSADFDDDGKLELVVGASGENRVYVYDDGLLTDCNENLVPDRCDIAGGTSLDCNDNDVPDECETDCNENGVPDDCDIADGTSEDCNLDAVPDECQADCDGNGIPDDCDIAGGAPDCDANGVLDACDILDGAPDCNANGVPDLCDVHPSITVTADAPDEELGTSVAFAGDLDGDGSTTSPSAFREPTAPVWTPARCSCSSAARARMASPISCFREPLRATRSVRRSPVPET